MNRWTMVLVVVVTVLVLGNHCWGQGFSPSSSSTRKTPKKPTVVDRLLFFPTKFPDGDWNPEGLRFEDVVFTSEDGTTLHGWYCPAENPRGVVLMAHGNAGHVASRANWLRYLQTKMGLSVFLFDYRGYGQSEGTPTVEGVIQDATAARAKLRELASVKDSEMILMGESLGGAVVTQLAADSAPRALILQSTFSSLRDVAAIHFSHLSVLVPKKKLDSVNSIASYKGPLLQSHGDADRTIPFSLGEKLFKAANEPKTFVKLEGADHNDWLTDKYLEELNRFLDGLPAAKD
jgi:fermentation-respiration switch protein FrsA (DUF1100 family)